MEKLTDVLEILTDSQGESVLLDTPKLKSEIGQRNVTLLPKTPAIAVLCRADITLGAWCTSD